MADEGAEVLGESPKGVIAALEVIDNGLVGECNINRLEKAVVVKGREEEEVDLP